MLYVNYNKVNVHHFPAGEQSILDFNISILPENKVFIDWNYENDEELVSYPLSEDFPDKDAVCFGELIYDEDNYEWNFKPMKSGYQGGILYLANKVF